MKRGLDARHRLRASIQAPDDRDLPRIAVARFSYLGDVRPEVRAYVAPLADVIAGKAQWTQVADLRRRDHRLRTRRR